MRMLTELFFAVPILVVLCAAIPDPMPWYVAASVGLAAVMASASFVSLMFDE